MTRQQQQTEQRQLGLAFARNGRKAKFSEGSIARKQQRARDRAAAKLNAENDRQLILIRRGTKLDARDTFRVLRARRMEQG